MRAFDGMLTASPGRQRQRQRHRTHATCTSGIPRAIERFAAPIAMWRAAYFFFPGQMGPFLKNISF